ncbi:MAG: N-acetylmuramoyl-L-alanine amidase [Clostridia bacterium]|nr:N-acetylmuramoyl-L-alanine amidase [Clostridia bacterium]
MKEIIKKLIPQLFFIFILCLSSFLSFTKEAISSSADVENQRVVIVDAGHGGFDGGAVAMDGTSEKDINLKIAKKLKNNLLLNGIKVIMTRESDEAINDTGEHIHSKKVSDMQNRLLVMSENKDAVFVSIHLNKFTTSAASGAQIFYSDNFQKSAVLANSVRESIISLLQPENKRVIKKANSSTYLLYNAKTPAIIVECGFLSNKNDLINLKSDDFQSKIAFSISEGIINFFGSDK